MIKKTYKLVKVDYTDSGYFYIKNVSNEVGEFNIINYSGGTLEYSTDGVNWSSYDLSTKPSVSVNPDSNIYLRGTGFYNETDNGCINFTKNYIVGGNFMSISNYSTMTSVTTMDLTNNIRYTLYNQTRLLSAEKLNFGNVTSISNLGLVSMFYGCNHLTKAPDLSGLTSIGSNGFASMFSGCTSLTTGPDLSNITTVGSSGCYRMFSNCSKLGTVTAPNIQNLTTNMLNNWLQNAGAQATGTKTVNVPTGATITGNSISGIPTGWTRVNY